MTGFKARARLIAIILGGIAAPVALPAPAQAQTVLHRFAIPAGDAATSLRLFARQSGYQVLFPYQAVAGRTTTAVTGRFSANTVLAKLAAESELTIAADDGKTATLVSAGAGPSGVGPTSMDYGPGNEIVVTATKRQESIRDVPIAITALRQKDIQRLGPTSTEDAMRFVPGVNFNSNGANSVNYTIRGVNTASATGNVQSTIALYVDDLSMLDPYFPRVTTNLRLFDVERLEVLKGPQGTLFGSGALGGAIRVITNKPDPTAFQAATELTLADTARGQMTYQANAMVNIPLVADKLALRAVGYYDRIGGYVFNENTGASNTNRLISKGGRVELRALPTERLTLTATALLQIDRPQDAGYTYYAANAADQYRYNNSVPNFFPQNLKIYSLTGEYDFGPIKLTSITSYYDKKEQSNIDFTRTSTTLTTLTSPATIHDSGPSHTFQQELRLASSAPGRFQWLIGGIYNRNRRVLNEYVDKPGAGARYAAVGYPTDRIVDSRFRRITEEGAIFGEATYSITERLKLTAGLRAFKNKLDVVERSGGYLNRASAATRAQKFDQSRVNPKFAATYQASRSVTVYAQAAQGYRIGQTNVAAISRDTISGEVIPNGYGADHLWNYEVGIKTSFLGGRVTLNAAGYYIDWKNIQLASRTSGLGLNYISNAGDATIRGIETAIAVAPTHFLDLGTSLSYVDARLDAVRNGAVARVGDQLPGSAKITSSGYVQLHGRMMGHEVYVRADSRFIGREYATLNNPTSLVYGDFADLNLRAGIVFPRFELTGFVTNLLDSAYIESALSTQGIAVAVRQRPRTIGATLRAGF